jgi:taurine dioxygenase
MSTIRTTDITVRPLTPTIGAEILGVDLSASLTPAAMAQVKQALWDHQVIFFRDQHLSPQQHLSFGEQFGSLHVHPLQRSRHPEHEELLVIHADANSTYVAGEDWHTDVSCEAAPPMGSMLYLTEVPPTGGDTLWASMYAAHDALSTAMKEFLEGLTAIHDGAKPWLKRGKPERSYPRTEHPVVTVHPETGRKILFVNRGFTINIPQLSAQESDATLEFLYRHLAHPLFQCRFRWEANSIAFWDNRCTQHHAMWDYFPARRHGHRVTVNGHPPLAANPARIAALAPLAEAA